MKTLAIFISTLLLLSNVYFSNSISLGNSKLFMKEVITLTGQSQSNASVNLLSAQVSYGEDVSSYPDFKNRGYKCIKVNPNTREAEISKCSQGESKCNSKGVLIYGPNAKGEMVMKFPFKDTYACNPKDLKLDGVSRVLCHSYEATLQQSLNENESLTINVFNHSYCALEDPSKYVFVKQGESFKCEKSAFSAFSDLDKIKSFKCQCFIALFPDDKSLKSVFTPIRISNKQYKCLKAKSSFGTVCEGYLKEEICAAKIEDPIKVDTITDATPDIIPSAKQYYFNRWICPFESGLNFAVRYDRNGSKYSIACLSRSGNDCFYDELANEACKKVNSCEEAKKEFKKVTCGTADYKSKWDNNGFDTPLDTWCKRANAWLRFDSNIIIASDKSRGTVLLPNGLTSCVAESDSICLAEGDKFALSKIITKFDEDVTLFKGLLKCDIKVFPEARTSTSHWCSQAMILPDDKGEFDIGLSD